MSVLDEIQQWYIANCDGDWEHLFGIKIETLDDPGWSVTIDLDETVLEDKSFETLDEQISEERWIHCSIRDKKFLGYGDETRLQEILIVFRNWAQSQSKDWLKPRTPLTDEERQELEDAEFLNELGEETGTEICKNEGCTHQRIKYSVMCRHHHFEMVKKRPLSNALSEKNSKPRIR